MTQMSDLFTRAETDVINNFGHDLDVDFHENRLARRLLEMPNTTENWYLATAVTLAAAYIGTRADVDGLADLLTRALEELRLIRMKDCGAVYDVTLRLEMAAALERHTAIVARTAPVATHAHGGEELK